MSGKPVVLCFSGLDPTGGAGLQADIETLFSLGCHCAPVATALTVQNTRNAEVMEATDPALLARQARAVLEDMPVQCFKIGLSGGTGGIEAIHGILRDYPHIPVVLDPVIRAGGGYRFGGEAMSTAIRELLAPLTTVLTPNTDELRQLAPAADSPEACAGELLELGCGHILLTGAHAGTAEVTNTWFAPGQPAGAFDWPRLANSYHGSGCTLAAAIAAYLARGLETGEAIRRAQQFCWESLSHGTTMGAGQHLPDRAYWNR